METWTIFTSIHSCSLIHSFTASSNGKSHFMVNETHAKHINYFRQTIPGVNIEIGKWNSTQSNYSNRIICSGAIFVCVFVLFLWFVVAVVFFLCSNAGETFEIRFREKFPSGLEVEFPSFWSNIFGVWFVCCCCCCCFFYLFAFFVILLSYWWTKTLHEMKSPVKKKL